MKHYIVYTFFYIGALLIAFLAAVGLFSLLEKLS